MPGRGEGGASGECGDGLARAWDRQADDWIHWARSPRHDHAFWRLNLPCTLSLLPPPGGIALDVGCGEGRLARELTALGHRVVGVESSPALAAAARQADPGFDVHVANAARMPLPDDHAHLAVASLSLMNMDDPAAALRETARVLAPGGVLVASLLHPLNTLGDAPPGTTYYDTVRYSERLDRDGLSMTFHDTHRPLSFYTDALTAAGFAIDRLVEPRPDAEHVTDHPEAARWLERPAFLHLRTTI